MHVSVEALIYCTEFFFIYLFFIFLFFRPTRPTSVRLSFQDCMLLSELSLTLVRCRQVIHRLHAHSNRSYGLIINEKKTKYLKCTKKDTRSENLNINNLHIEQVQQYKYLVSIINDSNSIEEDIKEGIALGIKAYYANQKFFKSRLVTKYLKLKLYRTVISPIVTYSSET